MLESRRADLLGRYETELLSGSSAWSPGPLANLLPPGHNQGDFALLRGADAPLWVAVSTGPLSNVEPAAGRITLFNEITHRKEAEERLRAQAFYDPLTGLPNRSLLEDRVQQAILAARRSLGAMAMLFVDLDRFKAVNDAFGHLSGDDVLRQVARRLQESVREYDALARYGGDEFVVFLNAISGGEDAARAADRVRKALRAQFYVRQQPVEIGASVGFAVYPTDGDDFEKLLRAADDAMYAAKRGARTN
jgi:diguanylate cyclase (GGDEF)-like protein